MQSVKNKAVVTTIQGRLAKVRKDSGMALRPFGEALRAAGWSGSYGSVSNYEEEGATVPADYVAAVCKAFGKSPVFMLWGEGPEDYTSPTDAERLLNQMRELLGVRPGGGKKIR